VAIAVDASSPVRFNLLLQKQPTSPFAMTSASFTAPANALLVACSSHDGDGTAGTITVTDSGGLAWTERVSRTWAETTLGAASFIVTARTTSAVARTVTVTRGVNGEASARRGSCKIYVLTGVDVDGTPMDTVGANNEGGSTTNDITTTSITPGETGLLICCDCDWTAGGVFTSSDLTIDTATHAGEMSVCSGYKVCTSGVAVTGNLNAGGTAAAQHKWCQLIVREVAAAASTDRPPESYGMTVAVQRAGYW
jgi:hypothetical protein